MDMDPEKTGMVGYTWLEQQEGYAYDRTSSCILGLDHLAWHGWSRSAPPHQVLGRLRFNFCDEFFHFGQEKTIYNKEQELAVLPYADGLSPYLRTLFQGVSWQTDSRSK